MFFKLVVCCGCQRPDKREKSESGLAVGMCLPAPQPLVPSPTYTWEDVRCGGDVKLRTQRCLTHHHTTLRTTTSSNYTTHQQTMYRNEQHSPNNLARTMQHYSNARKEDNIYT